MILARLAVVLVAFSAFAPAETAREKGKRLIDETVQALGGSKFLEMKDRVEIGRVYSFYREQLRGLAVARIATRYLTSPRKFEEDRVYLRERQSFGKKKEEYAVMFDEEKGYTITYRGAQPVAEDTLTRFHESTRRNILYTLRQRLEEPGLFFEAKGAQIFENQPVEVVDVVDQSTVVVTVYLHQSTKLPIRQVYYRRDPVSRVRFEEVTMFAKFRDCDGIQWPFTMSRFRDGDKIFEIFSEQVIMNSDLSDEMFTLTAKMKLLPMPR